MFGYRLVTAISAIMLGPALAGLAPAATSPASAAGKAAAPVTLVNQAATSSAITAQLRITHYPTGNGPLRFTVQGSGFAPGETVTVRGTDSAFFGVETGIPQSPTTGARCAPVVMGAVQVTADSSGGFTASIDDPQTAHTGGEVRITATGDRSGANAVAGLVAPEGRTVTTLPPGCLFINPPPGMVTPTATPALPSALPNTGAGGAARNGP